MNPDIDLKTLWGNQEISPLPDFKVVLNKAGQLKKKTLKKSILRNLVLVVTIVLILLIVFYAHPKMITTKIGIVLTILSMLLYIIASGSIIPALYKSNPEASINDYLKQLIWIKRRNEFIHSIVFTLYFIFLSAGMFLYLYEYVQTSGLAGKVLTYGIVVLWIAFNWFYTRKRRIAKEQTEINEMISKLEGLRGRMMEE